MSSYHKESKIIDHCMEQLAELSQFRIILQANEIAQNELYAILQKNPDDREAKKRLQERKQQQREQERRLFCKFRRYPAQIEDKANELHQIIARQIQKENQEKPPATYDKQAVGLFES